MSTVVPVRSPGDDDLQQLYNDVLAGFRDESTVIERSHPKPVSSERELESLYNSYGGTADDDIAKPPPSASSNVSRSSPISAGSAVSAVPPSPRERPLPNPRGSPTLPPSKYRPLPRPPGPTSPSPTSVPSMPEPHPYSKHDSTDSTFRVSASNGAHTGTYNGAKAGLPAGVRPPYNGSSRTDTSSTSSSTLDSPRSMVSVTQSVSHIHPMPTPQIGTDWRPHTSSGIPRDGYDEFSLPMRRAPSFRPSGASPPVTPGYGNPYGPSKDVVLPSAISSTSSALYSDVDDYSGFLGRQASSYRAMEPNSRMYSPTHLPSPSLGSNGNLGVPAGSSRVNHLRVSSDDLRGSPYSSGSFSGGVNGSTSLFDVQDPRLGRSISAGSAVVPSPSGALQRNISAMTDNSTTTSSSYPHTGTSSTSNTTVDRGNSFGSYLTSTSGDLTYHPLAQNDFPNASSSYVAGSSGQHLRDHVGGGRGPLGLHEDDLEGDEEYDGDYSEPDDDDFANFSLLSHIAVRLRDKVPRGTHVKGSIPYRHAFTGKDIVSTIQSQIQRDLQNNYGITMTDRSAALQVARSLQSQLFFYEVEWGGRVLQDGVEDVYMFLDDQDGASDSVQREREELPTGVIPALTKCYVPSCSDDEPCYCYSCPFRQSSAALPPAPPIEPQRESRKGWSETVDQEVLERLPASEINRQTIIHKVISKEEDYLHDLDAVEAIFIRPLRKSEVIRHSVIDKFINEVFGNILDLRQCNRNFLEEMNVRQREQGPVINRIGDVFLGAATQFRQVYPAYIGNLPIAEKRLKDEIEENSEFRLFLEECLRNLARNQEPRRFDLKHFLTRPSEHLQKYPVLFEAILNETADGNPDADYLQEAIQAIKSLQTAVQLRTFQCSMGRGQVGKLEWHELVSTEERQNLTKEESKRQSIIFELIKGEMAYVKDLENIDIMYVQPLRSMDPPIIPRDRLETFIRDVFHNFGELHAHHRRLLDRFFEIQCEEHPVIRTITAPMFDAALNFREAYMEYIPNYPIAAYRIDDEIATNPAFKAFVDQCVRHPESHRLDMKNFINRPIPRLLRYELLLRNIMDEAPPGHEDRETIPQVLDVIKALGKETEPGVVSAKQKVELWRYNSNLVFKPGESIDMDLLDENRSLIHTGKLLRAPEGGLNGWSELYILLFDNYLVMTKPKEKDGLTKYHVNRRPIPLDLLTLANFIDPPTQRGAGFLGVLRGGERHGDQPAASPQGLTPETTSDSRAVFPCTIHHNGRLGGLYTLYAETQQARAEWKQKLEEAIGLRKVVQESNRVFEIETLSVDTFLVPSMLNSATTPSWSHEGSFTGKVTCSVPFTAADGRGLVAIGCAEGVWIGFRHDSKSMRRVLHLKMVTQCAMLSDFGIFLVLADKSLFAYHIEALVPSGQQGTHNTQPQKLNGTKDVHFFSVGSLHGRTLVIYMKKKGLDSVFRVLEPVVQKINEKSKAPVSFGSRLGLRTQRSDWFRIYRDFFLPSESFDLIFLKAKIAVLCTKGFEIMDLNDFKSVTIPQRDDPRLEKLAKRCESCRPIGMFRSNEEEFLLCYDEFGLYVDKHGDPSRSTGTIEWEGTAERAALHPPYVMLFDSRFIEVRHIETGRLAQIIPGNDMRCIWDGRGVSGSPHRSIQDWQDGSTQEARVHGVVNATEPQTGSSRSTRAVTQHVFELLPTIPLYLPGSLSSPSTTYFPQSSSPPHSPKLNPSLASGWR